MLVVPGFHQDPVVQNCLTCVKAAVTAQMDNLYTTALLSYTFTLAGDEDMRSKLITFLHLKSTTEGTTKKDQEKGLRFKADQNQNQKSEVNDILQF